MGAETAVTKRRVSFTLRTVTALAAAYALPIVLARSHLYATIDMALWRIDPDLSDLMSMVSTVIGPSYVATLFVATLATTLGFLGRTLARARVRAGLPDPLERARALAKRSPGSVLAWSNAPAFGWMALLLRHHLHLYSDHSLAVVLPGFLLPAGICLLAQVMLTRAGIAAFVTPTLDEAEAAESARDAAADGFTFDAVAVTRETRAAVGGLSALSAAMTAAMIMLPVSRMREPGVMAAILAYLAIAAGSAVLFRRASQVSIGLDGVLVRGSSRTRFFGFRDVDAARVRGSELELLRGSRVVLRLQLHGKDAGRREALLTRLTAAIARASAERDEPAASFVNSASVADLTRAAEGGGSYRALAVSREQLWSVLEGPAIDNAARRAAAEALATTRDPAERARLRVAAEHCAEPSVRVRMHELLDDEESAVEPAARALVVPGVVGSAPERA